jgi:F-type H+-transporting ATPase subunit b
MSAAWAAETAAAKAFYQAPEFWVMVAFVILIAGTARALFRMATEALDKRSQTINDQIEEAVRLREEAQDLLASYERKQRDAAEEAERIIARARAEAERLGEQAAVDLEAALKRRERQAMDRISQAEATALDEIRALAVDVALDATARILADKMTANKSKAMIDDAIKDLPKKLV